MGKITPEISTYPGIMHSHQNHVEISIIYSGKSEYLIRDRKQVIEKGDIIIYNSGIVHDELSGSQAQIGSYFFAVGNLHLPGLRENALIPDQDSPVFHVDRDFGRIIRLCEDMLGGLEDSSAWAPYITYFSVQTLLEIIWRIVRTTRATQEVRQSDYAGRKIKAYIDENYREILSLKTICTELGMSESYVSHVFKDMLGYSPMQYVLRRKIGEAQTLLISTDYPITKIAQIVGYDSQSHFNQRFSKYVGISPRRFRLNYKNYDIFGAD